MQLTFTTERLLLTPLTTDDSHFIQELVNTDGWIQFIGDRNVHSPVDAYVYIQRILDRLDVVYFVARLADSRLPIGVITLIKRDYLPHHDIGFAFLPAYAGHGYAYEAAQAVMNSLVTNHEYILATTIPENHYSIKLLQKIGLSFKEAINVEDETLHVYEVATDKLRINAITKQFFSIFTNKAATNIDLQQLTDICLPEALFINNTNGGSIVYNLSSFIAPRQKILTDGTLTDFEESEATNDTTIVCNIAHRHSRYQKSGVMNGVPFQQQGDKLLQFVKVNGQWKISSVVWEDDVK